MNQIQSRRLLTASSLAALLALGACGERIADNNTTQSPDPVATTTAPVGTTPAPVATSPDGTQAQPESAGSNTAVMGAPASIGAAASNAAGTVGERIDDGQITARINAGLAADSELSAVRIDVDTSDGVVTLTGPVPNAAVKERAGEIAKAVTEVKSVKNQLTVSSS